MCRALSQEGTRQGEEVSTWGLSGTEQLKGIPTQPWQDAARPRGGPIFHIGVLCVSPLLLPSPSAVSLSEQCRGERFTDLSSSPSSGSRRLCAP